MIVKICHIITLILYDQILRCNTLLFEFAASMKSQRSITSNDRFGASSATTELDDLMTQLDDLKLPTGPQEEPVS